MCNIYICIRPSKEEKQDVNDISPFGSELETIICNYVLSKKLENLNLHFITKRKEIPENEIIKMNRSVPKKSGRKNRRTKDDISPFGDLVKKYLEDGMEIVKISQILKVNYSSLHTFISKQNLRKTKKDNISPYLEQIKKYLAEEMTIMEISKKLKIKSSTLYKFIQKENLRKQRLKKDWSKVKIRPRRSKLDPYLNLIMEDLKKGKKAADMARENGWGPSTLNHYIRRHRLRSKLKLLST